ncbi:MAG: hypothetical protein GX181_02225 [Synergistaceae bacterium]|nr:hypothetical protein [Synergistota bacterium]NLM70764.1 hypothetical protein [Synergistaceae bacterium]
MFRTVTRICIVIIAAVFLLPMGCVPATADILLEGVEMALDTAETPDPPSSDETPATSWGSLSVALLPEDAESAGARWSIDGGKTWRRPEDTLVLEEGDVNITFSGIIGWKTPDPMQVTISGDSEARAAGVYAPLTASVKIAIDGPAEAEWSLNPGKPGGYTKSDGLLEGLLPGDYVVSFTEVVGWLKPSDMMVSLAPGGTEELYAAYIPTGSITIEIDGPEEAGWRLDGPWLKSGASLDGLAPGEYTVSFRATSGWNTPNAETVVIDAGEGIFISAFYARIGGAARAGTSTRIETPEEQTPPGPSGGYVVVPDLYASSPHTAHMPPDDGPAMPTPPDPFIQETDEDPDVPEPVETEEDQVIVDDEAEVDDPGKIEDRLVGNPGIGPIQEPEPQEDDEDPAPGEAAEPVFSLLDFNKTENARLASLISNRRRILDLGPGQRSQIRVLTADPIPALESRGITDEELLVLSGKLASLITRDAEGNEASPLTLIADSFKFQPVEEDLAGRFLTVSYTLTVYHSSLSAADPKLAERIKEAIESGEPMNEVLLREIRIFKAVGEGENIRLFDLVKCATRSGHPLGAFFTSHTSGPGVEGFFDARERDSAYVINFRALLFDGAARNPDKAVQPFQEGWFIFLDGLKDGIFSDPIILAVPSPNSDPEENTNGCQLLPGGTGTGTLLLLLPLLIVVLRRP